MFIDCGYQSYEVYGHCAEQGWTALMGDKRATFTHRQKDGKQVERFYSPKRQVDLGYNRVAEMYFWSNLNVKDALFRLRKNTDKPPWEVPFNCPQEYLDMLDSESRSYDKGRWVMEANRRPSEPLPRLRGHAGLWCNHAQAGGE